MTQIIDHRHDSSVPAVANTSGLRDSSFFPLQIHLFPMCTIAEAREEFGDSAQDFLRGVSCNGCGADEASLEECTDCGARGCDCLLSTDDHDNERYCPACARTCMGCRRCE